MENDKRGVGAELLHQMKLEMLGGDNSKYFEECTPNQYIYDVLESAWVRRQLSKIEF